MPSERAQKCFSDIVAAIDLIASWVADAGGVEQAVHHNVLVRNGVERQLLIISEAAIRLDRIDPALAPRLAADIDWPGIRGVVNFIRHKYDDLDSGIIADVLTNRLGAPREASLKALRVLEGEDGTT